jgi:hypothetical protein
MACAHERQVLTRNVSVIVHNGYLASEEYFKLRFKQPPKARWHSKLLHCAHPTCEKVLAMSSSGSPNKLRRVNQ